MKHSLFAILILAPLATFSQKGDFWQTDFEHLDSIALHYHGRSIKHPDRLTDSLVQGLDTDVEKFRVIFRWITDNITYDGPLYHRILRHKDKYRHNKNKLSLLARRTSKKGFRHMIQQKKAICGGYATLLDYMCGQAGIQSVFISGYARTYDDDFPGPNHAWNAVRLNGKWYLCDVTWVSGSYDFDLNKFRKHYTDTYFLTDPHLFIANHYPSDIQWTLLKEELSLKEFFQAPLKLEGFISNKINKYSPEKGLVRIPSTEPFRVSFTSNANRVRDNVKAIIKKAGDNNFHADVDLPVKQNNTGEFVFEYSFQKKGTYYVYLHINNRDTMVYHVVVF